MTGYKSDNGNYKAIFAFFKFKKIDQSAVFSFNTSAKMFAITRITENKVKSNVNIDQYNGTINFSPNLYTNSGDIITINTDIDSIELLPDGRLVALKIINEEGLYRIEIQHS